MDTALDEVALLANSENRIAVLRALVDGPLSRDDLRDRIDASRVTIARVLRELEARNWIEGSGQEYAATPLGEWVCDEFTRLVEELKAERRLREPVQWLPDEVVTFDLRRLRDAEVILVDECDSTELIRRVIEFHRSGDRIRGLARSSAPRAVKNHWELTVHGETRVELVITPAILDAIRDHEPTARRFREMLDEETAQYYVHDGVPVSVAIVDGAVGITLADEDGVLRGGLKTEDETVLGWAEDLFRRYRGQARPIEPGAITT